MTFEYLNYLEQLAVSIQHIQQGSSSKHNFSCSFEHFVSLLSSSIHNPNSRLVRDELPVILEISQFLFEEGQYKGHCKSFLIPPVP